MSSIEDDGSEFAQDWERAHVDDEVVVPEAGSALGEGDTVAATFADFLDGVTHVGRSDELALLDIDGAIELAGGVGGCDEKVGLAAEKCGDLKQIDGLGNTRAVFGGMDVGEDGEIILLGDRPEDAGAFDDSRATEAMDRGAVGFVVAGFED